jgi:RNA polymerase sigma factor (sigma-70 family)
VGSSDMKVINKEELHSIFQKIDNRNEEDFSEFYKEYGSLIYSIAFSIVKNKEDSEDIKQKVFIKIWNMKKDKLPTDNESSWLYTVTKNETLNYLRDKQQEISIEELYSLSKENEEINKIIDKDSYNRIISKLNIQEQEIVSLKVLANFSFKEISQMLNVPVGTVQWKYYKSIYALRTWIGNLIILITSVLGLHISKNAKGKPNFAESIEQNTQENVNKIENSSNSGAKGDNDDKREDAIITPSPIEDEKGKNEMADTNTIRENETTQTTTKQEIEEYSYIQTGLISIATICLIITITFSIILIKHQQNRRKKVSK